MRNKLILDNEKLVYLVLKDLKMLYLEDSYYDVGVIGLVKAGNTWDESKGVKFSTYAYRLIKNEILQQVAKETAEKRTGEVVSLHALIGFENNEEITLEDKISSDFNMEEVIEEKEIREMLYTAMATLTKKEQEVIIMFYGIGRDRVKLEDIAKELGICREAVSHRKERALNKLKYRLEHYEKTLLHFNNIRNGNDRNRNNI